MNPDVLERDETFLSPYCADHDLYSARYPTYSIGGTRVYLLCSCGRQRDVSPEAWQAEEARRRTAAASSPSPWGRTPV